MLSSILLIGLAGKMNTEVALAAGQAGVQVHRISRNALAAGEYVSNIDVIIDFSLPDATPSVINMAVTVKKPLLICSTGHSSTHQPLPAIPICYAPNTSLVWAQLRACAQAIAANNPNMEIRIDDVHADTKLDSPSGTATELNNLLHHRSTITSVRMPRLSSWHTIKFYGHDEVITLEHQVLNRSVYARGALNIAAKLLELPAGIYSGFDKVFLTQDANVP